MPEARLNAGINTLNIALLDGQGKRIEQAVSFMATASAPRKDPSVTAMPENPAWSFQHLDADLRSLAERRSGLFPGEKGSPVTASRGREARKAGGKRNSAWMAPRVQRRERVRREKMALRKRYDAQTKLFAALSRSIEKGQWRPVDQSRQRRPHDKGEGG